MNDHLLTLLFQLMDKQLARYQAKQDSLINEVGDDEAHMPQIFKAAQAESMRILRPEEQLKLTKASQQFLMRMLHCNAIAPEMMERIMQQLSLSPSRIIRLNETKWTIRSILAHQLDENYLAFLDLILYQEEDAITAH